MNENDLYRSFQEIDDDILERSEGITKKSRKNSWIKWAVMATCLGLIMIIGIIVVYRDNYLDSMGKNVYVDENSTYGAICELEERYNKTAKSVSKKFDFSEEYPLLYKRCIIVEFNDKQYYTQSSSDVVAMINGFLLGDVIGTCKAKSSHNTYMDEILSVREISGVSPDLMIAVEMEGNYYVFHNKIYGIDTLGELLELYGLVQVLELNRFEMEDEFYTLDEDDMIWERLMANSEAKFVWSSRENDSETICFTATSESLGIYKEEFLVSADGYVSTTFFTYDGAFFIGEEIAGEIISYVKENSRKAGYEPDRYTLAGTLLEIGDDYILMNDSVLCKKWSDGRDFRVEADNVLFRHYFESGYIQIGDVFIVEFSGEFDVEKGNIELGPSFSITAAEVIEKKPDGFWNYMKDICLRYIREILMKNDKNYQNYLRHLIEEVFAGSAD